MFAINSQRVAWAAAASVTLAALSGNVASAQCPDSIPQSVINSIQDPSMRAQAAGMPRVSAAFIAQNGGAATMIQELRGQIAGDRQWLAQEEANQRMLAQQGMANDPRALATRPVMQMKRDQIRLSEAYLAILECHGRTGGGAPSKAGTGSINSNNVSADVERWMNDAENHAAGERRQMVRDVTGSYQPPRGYAGSATASGAELSLEDPFATATPEDCQPSISFRAVTLAADGAAIDYELSAVHSSPSACTVSFGIEMRAGGQPVRLPSRTLVIPPGGTTISESVRLPMRVESSTQACTVGEPVRRAYLERRDQLAAKYEKVQRLAMDTISSRTALERSVTEREIGNAILGVGLALDSFKLGLGYLYPPAEKALDFGQCVGAEITTYAAKTVAACAGKNNNECVDTVLTDGAVWVEKNLACAFKETFNTVDKLTDVAMIGKQALELHKSVAARSKTLEVLGELDHSLQRAAGKLAQIKGDRAYIDEVLRALDSQCRSPLIQLTAVDVKPLSTAGK